MKNRFLVLLAGLVISLGGLVVTSAPAMAVTKLTHAQATSQLSNAGITWSSSGNCSNRYNSTCTSFEQVNQSSISGIITLKNSSGCSVNITGGTETGHASGTYSHWNGYKLDITHRTCVDSYIKNSFTRIANRGDGYPQWKAASGNIYCDEGSHWDILYYTCGC